MINGPSFEENVTWFYHASGSGVMSLLGRATKTKRDVGCSYGTLSVPSAVAIAPVGEGSGQGEG